MAHRPEIDPAFEKELAELINGSPWRMADRLLEEFPVEEYSAAGVGRNTGLYAALEVVEEALRHDYGIELRVVTMRSYRATAIAWPADCRRSAAPFEAHRALRGRDNREQILAKLAKRHGYVTRDMVRDWLSEQQPKKYETWEQIIEHRARRLAAEAKTPEAQELMAAILMRVAADLVR